MVGTVSGRLVEAGTDKGQESQENEARMLVCFATFKVPVPLKILPTVSV